MSTFTNTAREVEMPNGDVVVIHKAPTGGENTTSNIKKFKYDDNGHVTESTAADAEDLNLSGYSTPTTGTTDIGTSDDIQTAIGKLDHQSHIDQTNILLLERMNGAKNICPNTATSQGIFTVNEDGTVIANGSSGASAQNLVLGEFTLKAGKTYRMHSNNTVTGSTYFMGLAKLPQYSTIYTEFGSPTFTPEEDIAVQAYLRVQANQTVNNVKFEPMVCLEIDWQASQQYIPYALPNYELTKLEAEDRVALVECVDEGAKNLLDFANLQFQSQGGTTYTKTDTDITVTSSTVWANCTYKMTLPAGNYVFSAKISNLSIGSGGAAKICLDTQADGHGTRAATIAVAQNGTVSGAFTWGGGTLYIMYYPNYTATAITTTFKASENMICTLADWKISQNYAPFALPNYDLTRAVSELQKKAVKVYTYHVNPNESDPEDAVTYLDDATGLTPAKMGASSFSYGSWANAWFLPKPCMLKSDGTVAYYLNPNDYSKKTDGTASDIADLTFDGNVMLEFPKIWVKRVDEGNGARTVSIAPVNVDGTYKCWSNINAEDKEVDHFYLPAYNGTIHSSKMRSLSGVTLDTTYAPSYTRAQEVTAATANNPTGKNMWYTETWADFCLIYDLLYLMGKSLDVQRTFGQGLSSGSATAMRAYVTGTHNAKGLFYGDISGTSTAVKVLGMENLWGCRWHGVAGLINDNGTLKVKMTYGVADGSTTVGYNTTGSGYLNYGSTYGTNGYVKKMQADNTMGYKIIETAGTDATYYCDYYYTNNSQSNYALLGGSSGSDAGCGFYVYLTSEAALTDWSLGGSLSCRPEA